MRGAKSPLPPCGMVLTFLKFHYHLNRHSQKSLSCQSSVAWAHSYLETRYFGTQNATRIAVVSFFPHPLTMTSSPR